MGNSRLRLTSSPSVIITCTLLISHHVNLESSQRPEQLRIRDEVLRPLSRPAMEAMLFT